MLRICGNIWKMTNKAPRPTPEREPERAGSSLSPELLDAYASMYERHRRLKLRSEWPGSAGYESELSELKAALKAVYDDLSPYQRVELHARGLSYEAIAPNYFYNNDR